MLRLSVRSPGSLIRVLAALSRRALGFDTSPVFTPSSSRDLERLLDQFGIAVPACDPRAGMGTAEAHKAVDRVRQVYEVRPDVREVFPLGLTPAQLGDYADWLFRHGRDEYGLRDGEILSYLFTLAEDPSCGLAETWLLSPRWQREVPDSLTETGWKSLKRWIRCEYRGQVGRWLREARYPERFRRILARSTRSSVNVIGHFKYDSGLQQEAFQHVAALERAGYEAFLRDVPIAYPRDCQDGGRFCDPEIGSMTLIKTGASEPLDEIYRRAGLHPRPGVYRIACWSWELEEFPRQVLGSAGLADEVWTPSEFCTRSVRAAMPGKPVLTMNPSVTLPRFDRLSRAHFHLPDDRFLFLFIFDMASGMERKNPLGLIRAFRRAFRRDDAVELVLKVSRGYISPEDMGHLREAAGEAGVMLIDRILPRPEVCALLDCCDGYISLHRSEGFGFTMAEAMLQGKPTIATAYSGNLDFMTPDNSFLVEHDRLVLDRDLPPYRAGCVWAEPSEEHAAELMRRVYENRSEAAAIADRGHKAVAGRLSEQAAAGRITARLRQIETAGSG